MQAYKRLVAALIAPHVGKSDDEVASMIEIPPNSAMGDLAFPCFSLAKTLRKAPQLIAQELADQLAATPHATEDAVERWEVVGAYLNIFLNRASVATRTVSDVLHALTRYGHTKSRKDQTVVLDFSAPNIAKHFGMGHLRGTMIGNALSRMYKAVGANVVRINHLGDWGTQFGKQTVAFLKWGDEDAVRRDPINELLRLYVRFHEEVEQHPELEEEARDAFRRLEEGDPELTRLWKWFVDESLREFQKIYDLLGVEFDSWAGESFFRDKVQRVVDELRDKHLLEESQGAQVVMLDELDLPACMILKSDGATIYATRDLAAAIYRAEQYKADEILYVVGGEQRLHLQQVFAVLDKMGYSIAKNCVHVPFGLMKIEGKKMSTRKGQIVLLEEVLMQAIEKTENIIAEKNPSLENRREVAEAVGVGAVIFNDLKVNRLHEVNFTWDEALNFEGETGPYVQYTYARCCSVIQKAAWTAQGAAEFERKLATLTKVPEGGPEEDPAVSSLFENEDGAPVSARESLADLVATSDYEALDGTQWELVKLVASLEDVLEFAVASYDPSALAKYVLDVCQAFNRFYHDTRILTSDATERQTRLTLVAATKVVIGNTLNLLGLKAPEAM